MTEEKKQENIEREKSVLSWHFPEYIQYERSKGWYIIAGSILIIAVLYTILTGNFLFALFLILFGLIFILQARRSPASVKFDIFESGISIGEKFYDWNDIKNFRIVYKPPETKRLYIDIKNVLLSDFSVPLEDQSPDKVRVFLKKYLKEDLDKSEENIIDRLGRWLKV